MAHRDSKHLLVVAGAALACLALATLAAPSAHATTYQYSVVDLGVLPGGTHTTGVGLNEGSSVVGWGDGQPVGYPPTITSAYLRQVSGITFLMPSVATSLAYDINRTGQVVGYYDDGSVNQQAYLWSLGSSTDIPRMGGTKNEALAINDLGQVVGWSTLAAPYDSFQQAFLYKNGQVIRLNHLGTSDYNVSRADDINNSSQVVGVSFDDSVVKNPVTWNGTASTGPIAPTVLPAVSGLIDGEAMLINDRGQIVGLMEDASYLQHLVLWQGGVGHDLGQLGQPTGLNNSGQIVGTALGGLNPWLYSAGIQYNLQSSIVTPGWTCTSVGAINNSGVIVGSAVGPSGYQHAVRLEPVLAPNTIFNPSFGSAPGALPAGWTSSGGGTALVVTDPHDAGNFAAQLTTGSPVTLTQVVSTPSVEFFLKFDYEFLTTNPGCTLQVLLNSVLVDTLTPPSSLSGGWMNYSRLVDDPALANLSGVNLDIVFDGPGSGFEVNLDNMGMQAVPEPATLLLLTLGGLALIRRRR